MANSSASMEQLGILQLIHKFGVNFNSELFERIGVVSICFISSYLLIKHIWGSIKMEKEPLRVLITGAAGKFLSLYLIFINLICFSNLCFSSEFYRANWVRFGSYGS